MKDKIITPVFNKAFQFIADKIETINEEDSTLEHENLNSKAVILESEIKSDVLLGLWDAIRKELAILTT